jgi:AcrR family transcriptional regulator
VRRSTLLADSEPADPGPELGTRELKKRRTRQLLNETAWRLFAERGFEHVTVAEVARTAGVSEATVFNYFPTKEALVFDGMLAYEQRLLDAVEGRDVGETALDALARFLTDGADHAAADGVGEMIAVTARMMAASPALRARQEVILADHARALAQLLALETGADAEDPGLQASVHALQGVHRTVLDGTRRAALAGERGERLAASVRSVVAAAVMPVAEGLGGYARRLRESPTG